MELSKTGDCRPARFDGHGDGDRPKRTRAAVEHHSTTASCRRLVFDLLRSTRTARCRHVLDRARRARACTRVWRDGLCRAFADDVAAARSGAQRAKGSRTHQRDAVPHRQRIRRPGSSRPERAGRRRRTAASAGVGSVCDAS